MLSLETKFFLGSAAALFFAFGVIVGTLLPRDGEACFIAAALDNIRSDAAGLQEEVAEETVVEEAVAEETVVEVPVELAPIVVVEQKTTEDESVPNSILFSSFRAEFEVVTHETQGAGYARKHASQLRSLVKTISTVKSVKIVRLRGGVEGREGPKYYALLKD